MKTTILSAALALLVAGVTAAPAGGSGNFACSTAKDCGKPGKLICCPNPPIKGPPHPVSPPVPSNTLHFGPGPVCVPPTFGCGTPVQPRCCHPDGSYVDSPAKREAAPAPEPTIPFGHGPECVPPSYGCGTPAKPRCCKPKQSG